MGLEGRGISALWRHYTDTYEGHRCSPVEPGEHLAASILLTDHRARDGGQMALATIASNSAHILLLEARSMWGDVFAGALEANSAAVGALRSDTVRCCCSQANVRSMLPGNCRPTDHHNFTAATREGVRNIRQDLRWQ